MSVTDNSIKKRLRALYKIPSILHACYKSRVTAVKTYYLSFRKNLRGGPLYYDFVKDTLFCEDENALIRFFR